MMTSQEILQAFQAGKISLGEAKKALTSIETSQASVPDTLNVACGLTPQAVQPSFPTQSPDQSDTHGQVASVRMPVMQGTQARQGLSLSAAASQVLPVPGEHLQASELGASKAGQDSHYSTERKEAIAIVGMSGKYPGARNLTEYWDNLVQGKNAIREIPLTRFDVSHYYDPTTPAQRGKISC